ESALLSVWAHLVFVYPATSTAMDTLSLHDALPILSGYTSRMARGSKGAGRGRRRSGRSTSWGRATSMATGSRTSSFMTRAATFTDPRRRHLDSSDVAVGYAVQGLTTLA